MRVEKNGRRAHLLRRSSSPSSDSTHDTRWLPDAAGDAGQLALAALAVDHQVAVFRPTA
jgi:hypothetical protein